MIVGPFVTQAINAHGYLWYNNKPLEEKVRVMTITLIDSSRRRSTIIASLTFFLS